MTFLVWRQYRLQWAIALALLAAFAAVELVNGSQMAGAWHSALRACAGTASAQSGRGGCLGQNIVGMVGNDLRVLSVMVPAVLGMLWGAPLVAHEMESGTTTFGWTQGITRTRWLASKVGILLLAAAVWAGAVSALVTWWSGPENAQRADAFQPNYFDTQGIAPIGYAVFAMALGITAGVLFRRTLPAIAVTLGGFIGLRVFFDESIRQRLISPVTTITSMASTWMAPGISWVLGGGVMNASGHVVGGDGSFAARMVDGLPSTAVPAACAKVANAPAVGGPPNSDPLLSCLGRLGYRNFTTYQPGSRYWAFQGIETGIYLALAAVLLAVTFYAIRRRDA
jgi:hypothetical protein